MDSKGDGSALVLGVPGECRDEYGYPSTEDLGAVCNARFVDV